MKIYQVVQKLLVGDTDWLFDKLTFIFFGSRLKMNE
jgi:hypothetical protein